MANVLEAALAYLRAGLGVLPVRPDGSKAPALPRGHPWLRRRATEADLRRWFAPGRNGIGIACGAVSGNLETLDFETVDACLALSSDTCLTFAYALYDLGRALRLGPDHEN